MQLPGMQYSSSLSPFLIGPDNRLYINKDNGELFIYKARNQQENEKPDYVTDTFFGRSNFQNPYLTRNGHLWLFNRPEEALNNSGNPVFQYQSGKLSSFPVSGGFVGGYGFFYEQNDKQYYYEREQNSIYLFNGTSFQKYGQPDIPGFKLVKPIRDNRLALCTNSGFFIANTAGDAINIVTRLFSGQTISAFCEDRNGNLWVGTLTEGIYFIPRLGLSTIPSTTTTINFNNVTAACKGPGNKLILGFLNGELGFLDTGFHYQTILPANTRSKKINSLFYSPELQLLNWWLVDISLQSHLGPADTHLFPSQGIGYSTKDIAYIPRWNAALLANPADIQLISLDKEPVLNRLPAGWLQLYQADSIFSNTLSWQQVSLMLSRERGRAVYFDSTTETCWGADKNGITLYRNNGNKTVLWKNEPIYATCFCKQADIIWAGSFSQGLFAVKEEQAREQYTTADGLVSNTIYKIIGNGNHLWVFTDKGLQYFDIAKKEFFVLDKTLGLPSYQVTGAALVNDHLFISTPKGLVTIADSISFKKDTGIRAYLQGIYCNHQIVRYSRDNFNTEENSFIFRIETPAYDNRALLRYKYRLKGAEKEFSTVAVEKEVFEYSSLQSGHYEFELYLTDLKGTVIGPPIHYSFTIKPPFYLTPWFLLLCLLATGIFIYWLMRRRIRQVQKREREKLQLAQLESDLKQSQLSGIKAQMNPHFMFNALNSIQEFILLNDKKQANMYMGKFADLMRMTLDMSNKKEVTLEEEIKTLQLYLELEALRFEDNFHYNLIVDENIDKENIHLPAMLIQPNVENAIKHGLLHKNGERKLELHFFLENHILSCIVTDNGIGRRRSGEINAQRLRKHTSFATGATQKRLELLNHDRPQPITVDYEDLFDEHGNANGTRVLIRIPLI